ncbi:MAG: hypothetical protein ACP5QW_04155 [bacterium]|uniref:hypothetical protein n=1 Tax=Caldisericum sp. TaxID=2499687 RepID=UPI003D0E5153
MENKGFFESLINNVVQGYCLEVMRKIPDNSVGATLLPHIQFKIKERTRVRAT